jgi:hypothetical protein
MPRLPKRHAETNLRHCKPKHQATANERRLHLGAGKTGLMSTLQIVMSTASLFCSAMTQLLALILAAEEVVLAHVDLDILKAAFDFVSVNLIGFLGLLRTMRVTDKILFDIPSDEEDAPVQYTCAKNLRIDDLTKF